MGFGKSIACKGCHHFPDPFTGFSWHAVFSLRFTYKFLFKFLHAFAGIEMAHRPPQQVCLCQAETCQLMRNALNLLLVQDYSEGLIQQRCKHRMQVPDLLFAFEAAHKGILESSTERTWTVQG